jgi:hypothetical protein
MNNHASSSPVGTMGLFFNLFMGEKKGRGAKHDTQRETLYSFCTQPKRGNYTDQYYTGAAWKDFL